ncbi:autotransporter outer membrane beta-barrel domain-containing protein [Pseudomonas sp. 31-12]|uniref:autotransporter outer membrane beta-barrel domain-containing protein n=1 Tax=Pseudomonas sp. 31-12 TaxID=2201356 RepID=UPI000D6BF85C|nr:autotransporter outer membrane beta-barrel domain-containing protein [Pseudomonas sp. 31-12]AWM89396.1 autotransporter outer membrane beta-barrel domain-containing protein [Pseudomonas sp. 31-12]
MQIQHTFRPHYIALAISLALGHAGSANAQDPASLSPPPVDQLAWIEAFISDPDTVTTSVTKSETGPDGVALKLGDSNDLVTVSRRGRFVGIVDGGGGTNALQLDTLSGGEIGESRNFNFLHIKRGPWTLTGNDDFSNGGLVMDNATLTNRGRIIGPVTVEKKATYRGAGQVGHLLVAGRLEVNALHGAPKVNGNLELQNTAELIYEVNADGRSETIKVDGIAKLDNATLNIVAVPGDYPLSNQYTLIQAEGVEGKFGKVLNDLAFMTSTVEHNGKTVELTFARNKVPIESFANSNNGRELSQSIDEPEELRQEQVLSDNASSPAQALNPLTSTDSSPTAPTPIAPTDAIAPTASTPSTTTNPVATTPKPTTPANAAVNALLGSNKVIAAHAIEQLAGGNTANLAKATLNSDSPVSATLLSAMRQLDSASGYNKPGNRSNAPSLAVGNEENGRVWLQALGHGGTLDRDHDALQTSTKGLVLGADWRVDEEWRIGVMGGKSETRLDSRELDGDLDSWHLGAYALRQSGPMSLRLGATYSNHDGSTKRRVAFNGFSDRPEGRYDASTQQAFAEVGYNLGRANVSIEPFASVGYQRYQRDGYTEKGGAAALKVHGQTQNNMYSTLGLRLAKVNTLDNGMQLTPRFSAGWKHTYGDVYSDTRQRLVTGGKNFTVSGAPLDRDSLLVNAGLDLGLSAKQTLGVGLIGEIGTDSRNHGVTGQWRMAF